MSVTQENLLNTFAQIKVYDELIKEWKDLEKDKSKIQVYYNVIGNRHLIQVVGRSDTTFQKLLNVEIPADTRLESPTDVCIQWGKNAIYFDTVKEKNEFSDVVGNAQRRILNTTEEPKEDDKLAMTRADDAMLPDKEHKLEFDDFSKTDMDKPVIDGDGNLPFATIEQLHTLVSTLCSKLDLKEDTAIQAIVHMAKQLKNVRIPGTTEDDMERLLREAAQFGTVIETTTLDAPKSRRLFIQDKVAGILEDLSEIAVDYQQKNWATYDDSDEIEILLSKLLDLLSDEVECEDAVDILTDSNYDGLMVIVKLFNEERRTNLKIYECKILGMVCAIRPETTAVLVTTDVPLFLAKCITNEDSDVDDDERNPSASLIHKDIDTFHSLAERFELLKLSLALCTLLFSSGGDVPIQTIERYDINFVSYLLDLMDSDDEELIDGAKDLILAYNLVFGDNSSRNVVCNTVASRIDSVKSFGEEIAAMAAKGTETVGQNSMITLIKYLLTRKDTANIFYTNDLLVVVEIIIRELRDLDEGDPQKIEFLQMYNGILSFVDDYEDHKADEFYDLLHPWSEGEDDGRNEDIKNMCKNLLSIHKERFEY